MKTRALSLAVAGVVVLLASASMAGDLNPPPGVVTPTMKTLTDVEPRTPVNLSNTPGDADSVFKITQPGSYYLTGNVAGSAGKHGVEITASGVTLDLNGFDLVGVPTSLDGVSATAPNLVNITIRNGSVRSWGDKGIELRSPGSSNCRVVGVLASGNAGEGLAVGGGSAITDCSAYQNVGTGIGTNGASTITNCSSYLNGSIGIVAGSGSTVTNCNVHTNGANGISASLDCIISYCTVRASGLDGILVGSGCSVLFNNCVSSGTAGDGSGIRTSPTATDCRIEGNNCSGADTGIEVDAAGNLIIRNSCSGNTVNYDFVAGNRYGPIVDITAGGTPAVAGSTAAGTLTSTDANANFAY